ncbi:MAG: TlpA family protein disulfide reductase [Flavobacteriia bacterium]|nr:TlpA family protein disulfide reductase [Flavobacteriia bacterium]
MKHISLLSLLLASLLGIAQNADTVRIPITFSGGFGPVYTEGGIIQQGQRIDYTTNYGSMASQLKGLPEEWVEANDFSTEHSVFDFRQAAYQAYHSGAMTESQYTYYYESKDWDKSSVSLSKKPISVSVHIAARKVGFGDWQVLVDANNNHDFGDDELFELEYDTINPIGDNPVIVEVHTEYFEDGYVVSSTREIKLFATRYFVSEDISFNAIGYSESEYGFVAGEEDTLYISSTCFGGRILGDLRVYQSEDLRSENPTRIMPGQFLEFDGVEYELLGLDREGRTVELYSISNLPRESAQRGFTIPNLGSIDPISGDSIFLNDFRGKYVLLDAWGSWCYPCIGEIPFVKQVHGMSDSLNIQVVGLAYDNKDDLLEAMDEHQIVWPQLWFEEHKTLERVMGIVSFPTLILVDPDGTVVWRGLRGEMMVESVLKELQKTN